MSLDQGWRYPGPPCPLFHPGMCPGSGTSVVSITLGEVEAEDSYCHHGVNRRKEGAD